MLNITLPDGNKLNFEKKITGLEVAEKISKSLSKSALLISIDGKLKDLNTVIDPLNTVKQMIEFALNFSENFYATLCDQERIPISKQMISHIESRAQDIARIKQLKKHKVDEEG